jgi:hypothetical protein
MARRECAGEPRDRIFGTHRVVQVSFEPEVRGSPTFVNICGAYPDTRLTVLIWGEYRGNFAGVDDLTGHNVCAIGTVRECGGSPEIIATSSLQLFDLGIGT